MRFIPYLLAITLVFATTTESYALFGKKKKKKDQTETPVKPKPDFKKISEVTKKCVKMDGLFTMYQDTTTGNAYIQIKGDQLEKEFIYFNHIVDGFLLAGHFRGGYRGSNIFSIHRHFNRIEFVSENTSYYYDPENPLSKASSANINRPIIFSSKIEAMDADGNILVSADGLFLKEILAKIKPSSNPKAPPGSFRLGSLSKDKTKYISVNNFPENTDVIVEYVYDNPSLSAWPHESVTDPRFVSVRVQHSLIQVPENDYIPRADDPRVGYFMRTITDMTSTSPTPYKDLIHRWHLVKKDPDAPLSEPVEPITFWVENTTPYELRELIVDAVLQWNIAFEQAGFKNAVVAKIQPDTATWHAADIRYNVLRWTSSPIPPFGGYGPSFVNPRTGQILGADIMLEYVYIIGRLRNEKLFETAALMSDDYFQHADHDHHDHHFCMAGEAMSHSNLFGQQMLDLHDFSDLEKHELLRQSLYRLVLHEVGHTLGLNHNFAASNLHGMDDIYNKELTMEEGLTGSVMEYPSINFALNPEDQGHYYDIKPGPYDVWAIEFGYTPSLEDEKAEAERMDALMARSTNPDLFFGNDADAMSSPSSGIDPRILMFDLSSDPIDYAINRMELVVKTFPKLKEKYSTDGESYHELRSAYISLSGNYSRALWAISKFVGGIQQDRSHVGQEGSDIPFVPVDEETQKEAMNALAKYAFSPDAFDFPEELTAYLMRQRRGFNLRGHQDPKIHDRLLNMQKSVLNNLLNPATLKRIKDSEMYGNTYDLSSVFQDLTNAIFIADYTKNIKSVRQNVQIEYIGRLARMVSGKGGYDSFAKSNAIFQLKRIQQLFKPIRNTDLSTKAHREHVLMLIEDALSVD